MNIDELKQKIKDLTIVVQYADGDRENYSGFDWLVSFLQEELKDGQDIFEEKIGPIKFIDSIHTEHANADHDNQYVFEIDGVTYALDTYWNSWGSGKFDIEEFYEAVGIPKTITEWKKK